MHGIRRRKEPGQEGFERFYLIWRQVLLQVGDLGIDIRLPLSGQCLQLIETRRGYARSPNCYRLRVQVLHLGSQPYRGNTDRRVVRVGPSECLLQVAAKFAILPLRFLRCGLRIQKVLKDQEMPVEVFQQYGLELGLLSRRLLLLRRRRLTQCQLRQPANH